MCDVVCEYMDEIKGKFLYDGSKVYKSSYNGQF